MNASPQRTKRLRRKNLLKKKILNSQPSLWQGFLFEFSIFSASIFYSLLTIILVLIKLTKNITFHNWFFQQDTFIPPAGVPYFKKQGCSQRRSPAYGRNGSGKDKSSNFAKGTPKKSWSTSRRQNLLKQILNSRPLCGGDYCMSLVNNAIFASFAKILAANLL